MRIHNVIIVLGSEREAVNLAPLVLAMRNQPDLRPVVVAAGAGQNAYENVLSLFDITSDFTVNIGGKNPQSSKYRTKSSDLDDLLYEQPDLVLVQAGTDTAVATTLDAFVHRVPVMHVGDALPTDGTDQWPAELDGRLATRRCALHLVSTPLGAQALLDGGVPPDSIVCTGARAVDSLLPPQNSPITQSVRLLVELDRRGPAAWRALGAIRYFLGIGPRPVGFLAGTAAA